MEGKKCFWIRIAGFSDKVWGEEWKGKVLGGWLDFQDEEQEGGGFINEALTVEKGVVEESCGWGMLIWGDCGP